KSYRDLKPVGKWFLRTMHVMLLISMVMVALMIPSTASPSEIGALAAHQPLDDASCGCLPESGSAIKEHVHDRAGRDHPLQTVDVALGQCQVREVLRTQHLRQQRADGGHCPYRASTSFLSSPATWTVNL